ncbi:hypothetical protein ACEPAF_394 [Sanghuangporus sanghuang]
MPRSSLRGSSSAACMPLSYAEGAPVFDGSSPRLIGRFLEDVELLCIDAQLTDSDRVHWTIYYASLDVADQWSMLPEALVSSPTWSRFVTEVLELYPEYTDARRRFQPADLEDLVQKSAAGPMKSVQQLYSYYRSFLRVSKHLEAHQRITSLQSNRLFTLGLPETLRSLVFSRFTIKYPDKYPDDDFSIQEVLSAAEFVLHRISASQPHRFDELAPVRSERPQNGIDPPSTSISTAVTSHLVPQLTSSDVPLHSPMFPSSYDTPQTLKSTLRCVTNVPTKFRAFRSRAKRDRGVATLPLEAAHRALDATVFSCFFCSSPRHLIRDCPVVAQYVQDGRCKWNSAYKIVLPSGLHVPASFGSNNLQERFDSFYEAYPELLESSPSPPSPPRAASPAPVSMVSKSAQQPASFRHSSSYAPSAVVQLLPPGQSSPKRFLKPSIASQSIVDHTYSSSSQPASGLAPRTNLSCKNLSKHCIGGSPSTLPLINSVGAVLPVYSYCFDSMASPPSHSMYSRPDSPLEFSSSTPGSSDSSVLSLGSFQWSSASSDRVPTPLGELR